MRLDYRKTLVLGLGFFSISIVWSVYNAFVPVFYERFVKSGALIGLLMITDNLIGVTIQPWVAHRSDRTWTRLGRRMPYLLLAGPVSALLFAMIPLHRTLPVLLATALGMNLAMGLYRAPTVALMPDVTPAPLRSQANGVINFMGGLGALIAFFVAAPLFRVDERLPFLTGAVLVVTAIIALRLAIREPARAETGTAAPQRRFLAMVRGVFAPGQRATMYLLLAIFAWFIGYQGVEAFFTLYAINELGADAAAGAFTLGFFALAFLAFSIPAGYAAARFGRRRTIIAGLAVLVAVFVAAYTTRSLAALRALFLVGGLGWAMINVNSYPMVVEMAGEGETGSYTGLYYFFSSGAAIAGPPVMGLLRDLFGYRHLFLYAAVPVVVAALLMSRVTGGEPAKLPKPPSLEPDGHR